MSLAVDDLERKKNLLVAELPPEPEAEKDTKTKLSEDINWFWESKEEEAEGFAGEEEREELDFLPPVSLVNPALNEYYNYFENVRNRIYYIAQKTYPAGFKGDKEDVRIVFVLTSDGMLKGEPRILGRVDEALMKAAKNAVVEASPFPSFLAERSQKYTEVGLFLCRSPRRSP